MHLQMLFDLLMLPLFILFPGIFPSLAFLGRERKGLEPLFLSAALSLLFNFYSLVLLAYFNLIRQRNVILLYIVVNVILYLRLRPEIRGPVHSILEATIDRVHRLDVINKFIIIYITTILVLESYHSSFFPIYSYDGLVYESMAKNLFYNGGLFPSTGLSGLYPIVFNMAWLFSAFGHVNELLSHSIHIVYAFIMVYYTFRLSHALQGDGYFASLLVVAFPTFVILSNASYMDIPFGALVVTSVYYLQRLLDGKRRYLALVGFLTGSLIIAKAHGLYFFILPALYLIFSLAGDQMKRRTVVLNFLKIMIIIILIVIPIYVINNTILPDYYFNLFRNQPGKESLWEEKAGEATYQYSQRFGPFSRPVMGIMNLGWAGALPTAPICLVLLVFSAPFFLRQRTIDRRLLLLYIIGVPYLFLYLFMLSYEFRYSLHWLPIFAVIASYNLAFVMRRLSHNGRKIKRILLVFLLPTLIFSLMLAIEGKTIGLVGGPYPTWAITHPLLSLEGKQETLLGDIYRTARFVNTNPEFTGAMVGIVDWRQLNFIFNSKIRYVTEETIDELDKYDYVIIPRVWIGNRIDFRTNTLSSDQADSAVKSVFSSGGLHVLQINRTRIQMQKMSDTPS